MPFTEKMMEIAIVEANKAVAEGEVPVGAALFSQDGTLVASDHNRVEQLGDPTAHAEMLVIKKSCQALETKNLNTYTLVVTLEPCAMCAQAASHARISEIRFGAYDTKSGGTINGARVFNWPTCHHKPEVYGGIMERLCSQLLREFFTEKRGMGSVPTANMEGKP